jgi:FtsH-binding integral membrane protein
MNATAARTFLLFVLLLVIIQLSITYWVMNREHNPDINIIFLFIISIIVVIILTTFHEKIPAPAQFALFTFFSYLFGLLFYQVKKSKQYSPEIINEVILSTISVFISMAVVGFLLLSLGIRLGFKMWIILVVGLLSMIISRIIISRIILLYTAVNPDNIDKLTTRHKLISAFGIFLFSGYVIYDTNIILQGKYYNKNEHIQAAISYYLDFVNLFSNKLSLTDA